MRQILRTVVLLSVMMLAASAIFAQGERRSIVDIPFAFHVGERSLPAGKYYVMSYRRESDRVLLIQSQDHRSSVFVMTAELRANAAREDGQLIFNRYGDQYYLSQVWRRGTNKGAELPVSSQERAAEVASNTERQTYVLTTSGN